ncbi:ribosomal protein l11 methyltransferase (PrmA) domain-containing protein [Ditylenchus destructor]|uniref:Ribosomal protein l11 methyltransferase (PrmA) domain-containing protein n=1 Tax=Ditylenchus destructor TaxID=166010 RepID=A0AAD4MVS4_9BILA|nr:ribosomal protein l11 methyltransferase (PrmA) domain-containing protein [Ditylenchus destructor]
MNVVERSLASSTSLRFSIASARLHATRSEYTDSIVNYLAVLRSLAPDGRRRFFVEFVNVLQAYLKAEKSRFKLKEVLHAASSLYEYEFGIWRLWAEWAFEQGEYLRSLELFKKASAHARNDIEWLHAEVSIENVKSNLIDAWHWRMINDRKRNIAFKNALSRAISEIGESAKVLDIGCGSGILSMLAAKRGAEVLACDSDPVMCLVAQESFERNHVEVRLSKCHSTAMTPPSGTPLCDILVTETVDCAIFGEKIVESVLDAKERLLTRPAIVIPRKATAIFSLLESDTIAEEHYYESGKNYALISQTCYTPSGGGFSLDSLPKHPYTCTYLNQMSDEYRLLSEPTEGLVVNFENSAQLKLFNGNKFSTDIILEAKHEGVAHAVTCWFRLNLFDDIELCTAPEENLCWQQAIFPFYPPKKLEPGQKLRFEVFVRDHKLHCLPLMDTWYGNASSGSEKNPEKSYTLPMRQILKAPADVDFSCMHNMAIREFFWQSLFERRIGSAIDCTDLLIEEGMDEWRSKQPGSESRISKMKMRVASSKPAIRYVCDKAMNISNAVVRPVHGQPSAIVFFPLSSKGLLLDDYIASVIEMHIRTPPESLLQLIPSVIRLKACLIQSSQLLDRSRLARSDDMDMFQDSPNDDSPHCGLDLTAMNAYKLQYFHEIDTSQLEFDRISDVFDVIDMQFLEVEKELEQLSKIRSEILTLFIHLKRFSKFINSVGGLNDLLNLLQDHTVFQPEMSSISGIFPVYISSNLKKADAITLQNR